MKKRNQYSLINLLNIFLLLSIIHIIPEKLFPSVKSFFSELNNEGITNKDDRWAQKVWNKFRIHNLGEHFYNIM